MSYHRACEEKRRRYKIFIEEGSNYSHGVYFTNGYLKKVDNRSRFKFYKKLSSHMIRQKLKKEERFLPTRSYKKYSYDFWDLS